MESVKIRVEAGDGKEMTISIPVESDIYEWSSILKSILIFLTFHTNTIAEILKED